MKASSMSTMRFLGRVIVNLDTKTRVKRKFLYQKFIDSLITQKPLDMESRDLILTWVLIEALGEPSLKAPGCVTGILQTENWLKVNKFEPVRPGKY